MLTWHKTQLIWCHHFLSLVHKWHGAAMNQLQSPYNYHCAILLKSSDPLWASVFSPETHSCIPEEIISPIWAHEQLGAYWHPQLRGCLVSPGTEFTPFLKIDCQIPLLFPNSLGQPNLIRLLHDREQMRIPTGKKNSSRARLSWECIFLPACSWKTEGGGVWGGDREGQREAETEKLTWTSSQTLQSDKSSFSSE